jgi:hypothetical protein
MSDGENSPVLSPNAGFNRPGVTDAYLLAAGCHHVDENECVRLYGFKAAGIAIPFRAMRGEPILDADKSFCRVRLYDETDSQKYSQRRDSGAHIYIPPGFKDRIKGSTLILVEGEFKALALDEAGYCAVGLCGINGAAGTVKHEGGEITHQLHEELVLILEFHRPSTVEFAGDGDVLFNALFASEAAKLRRLICGSKRFVWVEKLLTIKPPCDGPKGFDDCRVVQGEQFNTWFDGLLQSALDIPAKATAAEIFFDLLNREKERAGKLISSSGQEARMARRKLLQSSAHLWGDPAAKLELQPLLMELLDVTKGELASLIRDANPKPEVVVPITIEKVVEPEPELTPWDHRVNGRELLDQLRTTYNRFLILPPQADILLAVWTLHTYLFDSFTFTPYIHVSSPEKECGKSTLAELMQRLCANATTPGSMSAAAMFRRVERMKPVLLLDEWDTMSEDSRLACLNILNTGFKYNGVYTVCVPTGDDWTDTDFSTFCPKVIIGLSDAKLPDTTRSRCFPLVLQKKLPGEKVEKLKQQFDGLELRRKCLRWENDHRDILRVEQLPMPEGLSARQEDISEPLLSIGIACGAQWADLVREAIVHFCNESKGDEGDAKRELLSDIRWGFEKQSPADRMSSAALRDYLVGLEHRSWASWNDGRGITQRQISERLRGYRVTPHNIKLPDNRVVKGFYRADFDDAFSRYLPQEGSENRYSATQAENIDDNPLFSSATGESGSGRQNAENTNKDAGGSGVADEKSEKGATVLI